MATYELMRSALQANQNLPDAVLVALGGGERIGVVHSEREAHLQVHDHRGHQRGVHARQVGPRETEMEVHLGHVHHDQTEGHLCRLACVPQRPAAVECAAAYAARTRAVGKTVGMRVE